MTAPTCRWCGGAIRKRTRKVILRRKIGPNDREISGFVQHLAVGDDWPKTMADCQKLTNQRVVSIQYSNAPEGVSWQGAPPGRHIDSFGEWDGESYEDKYFCNGAHARLMGYSAAAAGFIARRK